MHGFERDPPLRGPGYSPTNEPSGATMKSSVSGMNARTPPSSTARLQGRCGAGVGLDLELFGEVEDAHGVAFDFYREVAAHDRDAFEAEAADPVGDRGGEVQLRRADVGLEPQQRAQEEQRRGCGPRLR